MSPQPSTKMARSAQIWARLHNPSDTNCARLCSAVLLLLDAVGCSFILAKVPYTEIDWVAYMQQVQSFLQGERDYSLIKGQTGPLVYPAGFLYIYSLLFHITDGGAIVLAQGIFALIYLVNQWIVMQLYIESHAMPPWGLALLCLSKRVHSIYLLRMFNDGVTMLIANIAILLLIKRRWRSSLLIFSAALSVKMNVLLLAPPVAVVLLQKAPFADIILGSIAGILLQVYMQATLC